MNKIFNSPFFKRFGGSIIMFVVAAVIMIGGVIAKNIWDSRLAGIDVITEDETAEITEKETKPVSDAVLNKWSSDMNYSQGRKDYDDRTVSDIFSYATTWHDENTYVSQRNALKEKYDWLSEDDKFLSTYFPSIETVKAFEDINMGSLLNTGVNTSFESLDSYVMSIEDGVYNYIADVTAQSSGVNGGGTARSHTIAEYKTDSDGRVFDITTYTVSRQ